MPARRRPFAGDREVARRQEAGEPDPRRRHEFGAQLGHGEARRRQRQAEEQHADQPEPVALERASRRLHPLLQPAPVRFVARRLYARTASSASRISFREIS